MKNCALNLNHTLRVVKDYYTDFAAVGLDFNYIVITL